MAPLPARALELLGGRSSSSVPASKAPLAKEHPLGTKSWQQNDMSSGWWLNQPLWKILVKMGIFPR